MADHRVARRYAAALFATASKHNSVAAVEDDLNAIASFLDSDPRFRSVMMSPEVSRDGKIDLCEKLFSDRTTAITMQALRLILLKGREVELETIRDEFTVLRREQEGVVFATVSSSVALVEKQQTEILARLRLATGKKVEAKFTINPGLIGGVKATFGNTVLDGSLRGGLASLRDKLQHDLLKQP